MAKKHTKHIPKRNLHTSWDPVAEWYMGWTGKSGSKHHRTLAIPSVLNLVQVWPGMQLLEIGCGHGVLAPYIARQGGEYTGVDISRKLIRRAKDTHGRAGRFALGDARKLSRLEELSRGSFDAAIFMLSVQDMEPLASVLQSAAWAVKVGGVVVLLMVHPCFRVPRQSGWGWDDRRKLQFRRVDRYLTPLQVPMRSYGGASAQGHPGQAQGTTVSFHRPLSDYINGLSACGFLVEQMQEIPTYKVRNTGKDASAENAANREIPLFLALKARKM